MLLMWLLALRFHPFHLAGRPGTPPNSSWPFSVVLTDWLLDDCHQGWESTQHPLASQFGVRTKVGRSASAKNILAPRPPCLVRQGAILRHEVPPDRCSTSALRQPFRGASFARRIPPRNDVQDAVHNLPQVLRFEDDTEALGDEAGGRPGVPASPSWASVKCLSWRAYALRSIPQIYRLPANHTKLFQCKFRELSHTGLLREFIKTRVRHLPRPKCGRTTVQWCAAWVSVPSASAIALTGNGSLGSLHTTERTTVPAPEAPAPDMDPEAHARSTYWISPTTLETTGPISLTTAIGGRITLLDHHKVTPFHGGTPRPAVSGCYFDHGLWLRRGHRLVINDN